MRKILTAAFAALVMLVWSGTAEAVTLCTRDYASGVIQPSGAIRYEIFGSFYDYGTKTDPIKGCIRVAGVSGYAGAAHVHLAYRSATYNLDLAYWDFNINAGNPGPWVCQTIPYSVVYDSYEPYLVADARQNVVGGVTWHHYVWMFNTSTTPVA